MDSEAAWRWLESERRAFADLLDGLTAQEWATPSLCEGWSVRDVVAHMMVGPTGSMRSFAVAMVRARGNFDRANHLLAVRAGTRPTTELAEAFRTHAAHRFTPPGMDWRAPITDFSVHRLDVLVPLHRPDDGDRSAWPACLAALRHPRLAQAFGASGAPRLTYVATDVESVLGEGPRVEAPAGALALALTRRTARLDELAGPGATTLRAWATG